MIRSKQIYICNISKRQGRTHSTKKKTNYRQSQLLENFMMNYIIIIIFSVNNHHLYCGKYYLEQCTMNIFSSKSGHFNISFFAIFDDFSQFCSTFDETLHFKKKFKCSKNLEKIKINLPIITIT